MMNCAECKELLVAHLEGLLDESEEQTVRDHLKSCEICRAELKGLHALQQRLVNNGKTLAQTSVEDEVMNRIVREQNVRLKSAAQAGAGLHIRRLIMRSSVVKIAVAAAVVLAVAGGLFLWTGTKSGVALADVLTRVEQIQAFMYKMTMHVKGSMEGMSPGGVDMEATMLIANEYGMRMDMSMTTPGTGQPVEQQMYMLPQQNMVMVLLPAMKKYMRMQVDEEMFEKKRQENNDPRLMLKKILECQYTDLGKTTLDGVEVQGFQTTDPAYGGGMGDVDVKVWVNMKTELPVRIDMRIKMNEQMEMEGTMHDFQWDVPVSAAEFNPVIPADFTAGPGDGMQMPAMTEETAMTGLKLCSELTGKYPDDLNLMTLIQTVTKSFQDSHASDASKVREPEDPAVPLEEAKKKLMDEVDEQTKKLMDKMMPIQSLGGFYMTLVQEKKEPAYYGQVVEPGDKALVLLRWKISDNEYRVIFGDLHAATVDADTLATLEAALPK
jgi:outer membrane lipoprotein-sorting protein